MSRQPPHLPPNSRGVMDGGAAMPTQKAQFGPMSGRAMNEADVQQGGCKIYEKLTPAQREELSIFLRQKLLESKSDAAVVSAGAGISEAHAETEWHQSLRDKTSQVIDQRTRAGQPADAAFVVEDVLPFALSTVDESVRRELFLKVRQMLVGGTAQGVLDGQKKL